MRRNRKIREHRERLLKERSASVASRRRAAQQKKKSKAKAHISEPEALSRSKRRAKAAKNKASRRRQKVDYSHCPAYRPGKIDFVVFDEYKPSVAKPINVVHILESVGLGGAQTMAMELMNGLNKYYGEFCNNTMLSLSFKSVKKPSKLFRSYGVDFEQAKRKYLAQWCRDHGIDVVVHHRTSQASCLKTSLPLGVKYILVNHTWNMLSNMRSFSFCDYYVTVCRFLEKRSPFLEFIHDSRKIVILNGVENDYLKSIPTAELSGEFKTGRCHRLVASKFSPDSLRYMANKMSKHIPGFTHHLIGTSKDAKSLSHTMPFLHYYGSISVRNKKMSIIKGLDVYYYETYGHEGASVAILESLACGVPVICKPLGGNAELVHNRVNGFVVADRSDFMTRMMMLSENRSFLKSLKQQTLADFDKRLHVRHAACKYMQIFERLSNQQPND